MGKSHSAAANHRFVFKYIIASIVTVHSQEHHRLRRPLWKHLWKESPVQVSSNAANQERKQECGEGATVYSCDHVSENIFLKEM